MVLCVYYKNIFPSGPSGQNESMENVFLWEFSKTIYEM